MSFNCTARCSCRVTLCYYQDFTFTFSTMTNRDHVSGITIMIRCSQSMDNFAQDIGILTYKWDNLNLQFCRKKKLTHEYNGGATLQRGENNVKFCPYRWYL